MNYLDKALSYVSNSNTLPSKNPLISFPALGQMEPKHKSLGPGTFKFIDHHIFLRQPLIPFQYPSHRRLMGVVYLGS